MARNKRRLFEEDNLFNYFDTLDECDLKDSNNDDDSLGEDILNEASLADIAKDRSDGKERAWKHALNDDADLDEVERKMKYILQHPEEESNPGVIETTLDDVLKRNKRNIRVGSKNFINVLFTGPAGTGKTSRIKKWAERNHIHLVHVLASVMDDTDMGGAISPDDTGTIVKRLASTELDELDNVENSVLFLDEYNRAADSVRGTLLTLIQDHTIPDPRVPGRQRFLRNFLFTIAAINPEGDYNVKDLDPAELTRFMQRRVDPDKLNNLSYLKDELTRMWASNLEDETIDDEERFDFAQELKRKFNLAEKVLLSPEFDFEESNDPDAFGITSSRTFTNLLMACDGTKKDFLDKWDAFCNPSQKDIIERILRDFKDINNKANSVFSKNKEQKIADLGDAAFIDLL